MADPCKVEGCVQRTDRLERSLCLQKEENEQLLRLQKEEDEERLRVQKDEHDERLRLQKEEYENDVEQRMGKVTMRYEERPRLQNDEHEEGLRVQKEECEERLRLQKEEHEQALLARRIEYYFPGYYPLPLEDFPLEIIALIADFVHDFDDLARMSLASHRLRNGVLLSYRWMIVRELIEATEGAVEAKGRRALLYNRMMCIGFACGAGFFHLLRALQTSHREIVNAQPGRLIVIHGRVDSLRHLHTKYGVTAAEDGWTTPMMTAASPVQYGQIELLQYLHSECGMTIPPTCLRTACCHVQLKSLKWLHSEVGFTVEDVRKIDYPRPLALIAKYDKDDDGELRRDCITCLRTDYGLTQNDAWPVIRSTYALSMAQRGIISDVFELD